jgi:hypothetical protein
MGTIAKPHTQSEEKSDNRSKRVKWAAGGSLLARWKA